MLKNTTLGKIFGGILIFFLLAAGGTARAQTPEPTLWQIGQADGDDKEFALAPGGWSRYGEDSFYIVGQSKPASDWNYAQPGPVDTWAGGQTHTNTIAFELAHAETEGTARLTLALVDTHGSMPPRLQITVNGHVWTRDTSPGAGDASINGQADRGRHAAVQVEFPARFLNPGLNTVQITTLTGSWIVYDAVTLTAPAGDTLGTVPALVTVSAASWRHDVLTRQGNTLNQILQLKTFNSGPPQEAELHVSGEAARPITVLTGHMSRTLFFPESRTAAQSRVQLFRQGQPLGDVQTTERIPCRRYTIYCLEQSHMDIGYAYLQDKARALHQQYLEDGLKMNAHDAALPSDDRFRWNIESLYEVDDWLKQASPAQIAAFRTAAQTDNLGLSALYCNELTGLCRPEELTALLACADRLRRTYGVPIDSAMISDVPGYTWGLVPVLAQSGVKYISWGPNGGTISAMRSASTTKPFTGYRLRAKKKSWSGRVQTDTIPDFNASEASLLQFVEGFARQNPGYPYDMIPDRHTQADNGPADLALAPFVRDWNSRYAYPHLVLSTTSHMFHDFAARYGSRLPRVRGDYTGYWEDGAASTARETAINRQAAEAVTQDQICTPFWTRRIIRSDGSTRPGRTPCCTTSTRGEPTGAGASRKATSRGHSGNIKNSSP